MTGYQQNLQDFERAVEKTGGVFYQQSKTLTVEDIVRDIQKQEAMMVKVVSSRENVDIPCVLTIVDNGSDDETPDIARALEKKYDSELPEVSPNDKKNISEELMHKSLIFSHTIDFKQKTGQKIMPFFSPEGEDLTEEGYAKLACLIDEFEKEKK